MGINSWVFKVTKARYPGVWQSEVPPSLREKKHVTVEEMQYVIKTKPEYIKTLHGFYLYVMESILKHMRNPECPSPHFTVLFDRAAPDFKHGVQKERDKGVLGTTIEPYAYDDERPVLRGDLPAETEQEPMKSAENWSRYTANRKLVQRELFPLLYNALLQDRYYVPLPGEQLFVHGLPIQWRYIKRHDRPSWLDENPDVVYDEGIPELVPRARIKPSHERKDPDIYNRVLVITKCRTPAPAAGGGGQGSWYTHRYEWKEAKSSFGEADLGIVYYWRFFRDSPHVIYMNDGDALPILLMHSFDRLVNGVFTQDMWLCKPRRGASKIETKRKKRAKKARDKWTAQDEQDERELQARVDAYGGTKTWHQIEKQRPKRKFININKLFYDIMSDPQFDGVVQNPVAFYVCSIIMSGTDFFPKTRSFLPGIGVEKKIWPTLFANAAEFSHMFQCSLAIPPDPTATRDVVVDCEAFVRFCQLCYATHVPVRTNRNIMSTARKHEALDDRKMRVYARRLLHNALYITNGYRPEYTERYPDAYAVDEAGVSVFGFDRNGDLAASVSEEYPFPIDEVFSRHHERMIVTKKRKI